MNDGWGMIFSWTVEYDNICIPFMESLEKSIYKGNSLTDLLFNFVLQNCENVAFSPEWWNNLSEIERIKIIDIVQKRNSMFYDVSADKNEKIELNIPDWNFKNTITNIEKRNANTQYSKKQ